MQKYLGSFTIHNYLVIGFLAILVISIGLISNNVSKVRDNRSLAASITVKLPANGPGFFNGVSGQFPNSGSHWDKVDESISDDDTTYIRSSSAGSKETFTHKPLSIPTGSTISSVAVYVMWRVESQTSDNMSVILAKSSANLKLGDVPGIYTSYVDSAQSFTTNPFTGGAWTVADVNALQIGVSLPVGGRATQVYLRVSYTPPPPPATPPSGGKTSGGGSSDGGSSGGNISGSGNTGVFNPSSFTGTKTDPNILNSLKITLSIPYLLGEFALPVKIGSFSSTLNIIPGKSEYELDVKGAKFPLGKDLTVEIGGNKVLTKKIKVKTKAPKQPAKFGSLYLGDTDLDDKVDQNDLDRFIEDIGNQSEFSDVNADGEVNSLDWAILLVNFGKTGSK